MSVCCIVLTGMVYPATYNCTTSGTGASDWATAASWTSCNGTYPNNGGGDTYTANIGNRQFTIADGASYTIGTGSGTALTLSNAAARLYQNGNLTVNADISMTAAGARYEINSVASQPVLTMISSATKNPVLKMWSGGGVFSVTGTAAFWVRIVGDNAAGGYSQLDGLNVPDSAPWYFRYVSIEGMGDPTHAGFYRQANFDSDYVRVLNCGRSEAVVNATSAALVRHWDIRPGANSPTGANTYLLYVTGTAAKTTGLREISGSTFYQSGRSSTVFVTPPGFTVSNNVFYTTTLFFGSTSGTGQLVDRLLFVGPYELATSVSYIAYNGGNLFTNCAFLSYATVPDTSNGHIVRFADNDGASGANVWDGCVRDAGGSGNDYVGDFLMTRGAVTVKNSIFTGLSGNIVDGLYPLTAQQTVEHITSHQNTNTGGFGSVVLAEGGGGPAVAKSIRSNIWSVEPNGVIQGGTISWTPQDETFVLDRNASYGLTNSLNLFHPTLGVAGYLRVPTVQRIATNMTALAGTTETSLIVAGTSLGIVVGDYITRVNLSAPVTAVSEGGGNTTLALDGHGNAATHGIAGLAPGMTGIYAYKRYWESGGLYGDASKGATDVLVNPRFVAPTRNQTTWDAANGGPGTVANVADEAIKMNGLDKLGAPAAFNPNYSIDKYLDYMRRGYMATNLALKKMAHDGADIGAVPITIYNSTGITGGGVY